MVEQDLLRCFFVDFILIDFTRDSVVQHCRHLSQSFTVFYAMANETTCPILFSPILHQLSVISRNESTLHSKIYGLHFVPNYVGP